MCDTASGCVCLSVCLSVALCVCLCEQLPSAAFSEDYQADLLQRYHAVFDQFRAKHLLAGEMAWNFADFMTPQGARLAATDHS